MLIEHASAIPPFTWITYYPYARACSPTGRYQRITAAHLTVFLIMVYRCKILQLTLLQENVFEQKYVLPYLWLISSSPVIIIEFNLSLNSGYDNYCEEDDLVVIHSSSCSCPMSPKWSRGCPQCAAIFLYPRLCVLPRAMTDRLSSYQPPLNVSIH